MPPDLPTAIGPLPISVLVMQGGGLYLWIQATKARVYPEAVVPWVCTGLALLMALLDFWTPERLQWTVNAALVIFGFSTGAYAVNKAIAPPAAAPGPAATRTGA